MVILGGSITLGVQAPDLQDSWAQRLFRWIQDVFPHDEHKLVNNAMPATTSEFASHCMYDLVPPDADIVVVEYAVNDAAYGQGGHWIDHPARSALPM